MKTISFFSITILLTVATSCNSGIDNSEDKATAPPATGLPQQTTLPQQPATNTPTPGTSTALNPAHGQPGHNCDLLVGAPLNSAPAPTGAPGAGTPVMAPGTIAPITLPGNAAPQPVQITPAMPQGNAKRSTARLNPAHGQPGHDCNVLVGQPLKQGF